MGYAVGRLVDCGRWFRVGDGVGLFVGAVLSNRVVDGSCSGVKATVMPLAGDGSLVSELDGTSEGHDSILAKTTLMEKPSTSDSARP